VKKTQIDLSQGTLDLLAPKTLQSGPTHGRDIARRIQQISRDALRVGQGSLYPARLRLEAFYRGGRADSEAVLNGRVWPCSTS
jgi:hypothetical protein